MVDVEDDEEIEKSKLPIFMEFNTIYYFKEDDLKEDDPPVGAIPLSECDNVEVNEIKKESNILETAFSGVTDGMAAGINLVGKITGVSKELIAKNK